MNPIIGQEYKGYFVKHNEKKYIAGFCRRHNGDLIIVEQGGGYIPFEKLQDAKPIGYDVLGHLYEKVRSIVEKEITLNLPDEIEDDSLLGQILAQINVEAEEDDLLAANAEEDNMEDVVAAAMEDTTEEIEASGGATPDEFMDDLEDNLEAQIDEETEEPEEPEQEEVEVEETVSSDVDDELKKQIESVLRERSNEFEVHGNLTHVGTPDPRNIGVIFNNKEMSFSKFVSQYVKKFQDQEAVAIFQELGQQFKQDIKDGLIPGADFNGKGDFLTWMVAKYGEENPEPDIAITEPGWRKNAKGEEVETEAQVYIDKDEAKDLSKTWSFLKLDLDDLVANS